MTRTHPSSMRSQQSQLRPSAGTLPPQSQSLSQLRPMPVPPPALLRRPPQPQRQLQQQQQQQQRLAEQLEQLSYSSFQPHRPPPTTAQTAAPAPDSKLVPLVEPEPEPEPEHASSSFAGAFLAPFLACCAHVSPVAHASASSSTPFAQQPSAAAAAAEEDEPIEDIDSDDDSSHGERSFQAHVRERARAFQAKGDGDDRGKGGAEAQQGAAAHRVQGPLLPRVRLPPHDGLPFTPDMSLQDVAYVKADAMTLTHEIGNNLSRIEEYLCGPNLHCARHGICSCRLDETATQPPVIQCDALAFLVDVYKNITRCCIKAVEQLHESCVALLSLTGSELPPADSHAELQHARTLGKQVIVANAHDALQRMADARADLQALAKHLVALCQFTTTTPSDNAVFVPLSAPSTSTLTRLVRLQCVSVRNGGSNGSSLLPEGRSAVEISCSSNNTSSGAKEDVTLVEAIVCGKSSAEVLRLDIHRSIGSKEEKNSGAKWSQLVTLPTSLQDEAQVNVCVRLRTSSKYVCLPPAPIARLPSAHHVAGGGGGALATAGHSSAMQGMMQDQQPPQAGQGLPPSQFKQEVKRNASPPPPPLPMSYAAQMPPQFGQGIASQPDTPWAPTQM